MERQLPKNVRQVGNVCDTPKIYVEDYVDTYLNQMKEQAKEDVVGVFLVGEILTIEDQDCVCVTGAVQMQGLDTAAPDVKIGDEILERGKKDCEEYFPGQSLVGWFLITPGRPLGLNSNLVKLHEKMFPRKHTLLVLKDAVGDEELYFAYKYNELMQMGGHYIFYEKNPSMQNYMIITRRQNGVTPFEMVEDRAAKDFRSTIKERMEIQERRGNSRFVYATSVLLVVVVLAIGISAMNNYDKMNSVQTSIETLSKSVLQTADGDAQAEGENESAQGQAAAPAEQSDAVQEQNTAVIDSGTAPAETQEEYVEPQVESAAQETQPVVSTIQEELTEEDYYIVQKGDTLDRISEKIYGTTAEVEAIQKMNGLSDGNLIFIGQKLLLP